MNTAIFSDTHGSVSNMLEVIKCFRPDAIIHLGDCEHDILAVKREFPDIPLYNVCGNCDYAPLAPESDTVWLDGVKVFFTHGHIQGVKWGLDRLAYAAMEKECSVALYGHTHRAEISRLGNVTLINPGSAGKGSEHTCAFLTTHEDGTFTSDILEF